MLYVTQATERCTVKCGCFSLTFHNRRTRHQGAIRCLVCGEQASLASLLAEWRADAIYSRRNSLGTPWLSAL